MISTFQPNNDVNHTHLNVQFFSVETFLDTVSSSFSGSETKSDFIDFNSNPVSIQI